MAEENKETPNPDVKVEETPKGDDKGGDKGKKRFSQEDQEYINELVNDVFARGHKKGSDELTVKLTDAQKQIDTLTAQIAELQNPKKKDKKDDVAGDDKVAARIKQLEAQLDETTTAFKAVQTERDTLKNGIAEAQKTARSKQFEDDFHAEADPIKFINIRQVFKDVRDELRHEEDGTITVMNPRTGQPKMNAEMKPVKLGDFLAEYARKNPHMVSTEVDGGTGSTETRRTPTKTEQKSVKKLSDTEFEAFHKSVLSGNARKP